MHLVTVAVAAVVVVVVVLLSAKSRFFLKSFLLYFLLTNFILRGSVNLSQARGKVLIRERFIICGMIPFHRHFTSAFFNRKCFEYLFSSYSLAL